MKHSTFVGVVTVILFGSFIYPNEIKACSDANEQTVAFFECSSSIMDECFISNNGWISSLCMETIHSSSTKTTKANNKEQFLFYVSYKKETNLTNQVKNYVFYTNLLHDIGHVKLRRFNV